jgi:hypothetical protein
MKDRLSGVYLNNIRTGDYEFKKYIKIIYDLSKTRKTSLFAQGDMQTALKSAQNECFVINIPNPNPNPNPDYPYMPITVQICLICDRDFGCDFSIFRL